MAEISIKPPEASNPTEFSVDLAWESVEGAKSYKIIERQIPNSWEETKTHEFSGDTTSTTLDRLEPTQTYQFKLVVVLESGEVTSEECTIDTQVTSCTPTPGKDSGFCVIL
mmetsp:Transcript_5575/g.6471  ORF Transcript_5575/g.6471 Transcript_5575/m.6471 type:complete len:111 (+) Transcript_5575:294-626(+)